MTFLPFPETDITPTTTTATTRSPSTVLALAATTGGGSLRRDDHDNDDDDAASPANYKNNHHNHGDGGGGDAGPRCADGAAATPTTNKEEIRAATTATTSPASTPEMKRRLTFDDDGDDDDHNANNSAKEDSDIVTRGTAVADPTASDSTAAAATLQAETDRVTCARPMSEIRDQLLVLAELTGDLSRSFRTTMPYDGDGGGGVAAAACGEVAEAASRLLAALLAASAMFRVDLKSAVERKMRLNAKKYPAHLCRGKAGKYTQYSRSTGITKTSGQSILVDDEQEETASPSKSPSSTYGDVASPKGNISIGSGGSKDDGAPKEDANTPARDRNDPAVFVEFVPELTQLIRAFAVERQWPKFHKPRNLLFAMIGELGELCELYQWKGDVADDGASDDTARGSAEDNDDPKNAVITVEEWDKTGQELADVAIYLLNLANACQVKLLQQPRQGPTSQERERPEPTRG